MQVVVLLAVRADELLVLGLARLPMSQLRRVDKMATGTLHGLEIRRTGLEPLSEDLRKNAPASAERADRVEPLKNGVTDERRLVGYFVQDLSQMLIDTEGNDGLF